MKNNTIHREGGALVIHLHLKDEELADLRIGGEKAPEPFVMGKSSDKFGWRVQLDNTRIDMKLTDIDAGKGKVSCDVPIAFRKKESTTYKYVEQRLRK